MSRARPRSRTASPGSVGVPPASGTCRRFRPRLRTRAQTTNILDTINRKQGLHPAKQWGKEPCAGLKITPPWRGKSARPGRSPRSSPPPPRLVIYRENEKISVPSAPPPTASAFAFRLGFWTPPPGSAGVPPASCPCQRALPRQSLGPHPPETKGTLLNYWNNLDRQILNSGYPTTSPTCPTCRASYSSNSTTSPTCKLTTSGFTTSLEAEISTN